MEALWQQFSEWFEATWADTTQRLILIFGVISFLVLAVGVFFLGDPDDNSPCAPTQYYGSCYHVQRLFCETSLKIYKHECASQVADLGLGPSRLPGPIVQRCQQWKFEKAFHYMRNRSGDCDDKIGELENWHRSNSEF